MLEGQAKYDSYKDSGIPWIGEVPWDWLWERGKWHHRHKKRLNSDGANDNVLSLTLRGVVNNDPDNPEGLVPNDYRTYQLFDRGDLVFKLIDLENVRTSRVGLVHESGIMSSAYIRVVPSRQSNSRFLYYFYYALYQAEVFNKLGAGVRSTLNQHDLLDLPVPVIDLDTQNRIVKFLDEKTAEIDAAIEKKRRLIDLLNEQKAILINRAVTKGLNPDTPMKDSGVDWIGEIPAHWDVKRLKYLFQESTARTSTGQETLFSLRMHAGLVPHDEVSDKPISDSDLIDYKHVANGQMVMNRMRAAIGIFGVAKADGLVSPDYAIFDMSDQVNAEYFLRLFKTTIMGMRFRLSSKGLGTGSSGFMRLYTENFGDLKVAVPPMDEQALVVNHIDALADQFEVAVGLTLQEISTLNEFRQTLIANAVTGKIKI
jgi:type I restriction enzyme, S subunit